MGSEGELRRVLRLVTGEIETSEKGLSGNGLKS